jgi:hypothetical protein
MRTRFMRSVHTAGAWILAFMELPLPMHAVAGLRTRQ